MFFSTKNQNPFTTFTYLYYALDLSHRFELIIFPLVHKHNRNISNHTLWSELYIESSEIQSAGFASCNSIRLGNQFVFFFVCLFQQKVSLAVPNIVCVQRRNSFTPQRFVIFGCLGDWWRPRVLVISQRCTLNQIIDLTCAS